MKTGIRQHPHAGELDLGRTSMVSGHRDRNQLTGNAVTYGGYVPQWCPAMKAGIS